MSDWILESLSDEQRRPFYGTTQNASILAAAGSGKTRTLTSLLLHDLVEGVAANAIIAFTFTEKAASELLARVHTLARKNIPEISLEGLFIGTIHSWCLQYLLQQPDFYNYSSLDELHVESLASRLHDALNLQEIYSSPYPRGIRPFLDDLEIFYNEHLSLEEVPERIRPAVSTFVKTLTNNRLMTFGDMIRSATLHLNSNGNVRGLQALYVDEYQDINPAQVQLIHAMLGHECKLVVVGDDLQCIYNWRGSDVGRILNFTSEFSDSSIFRLSDNYRARPGIVRVGNAVADSIVRRDRIKRMNPQRNEANAEEVHWLSAADEHEQAKLVADIVEKFLDNGVPPERIAVLIRSVLSAGQPIVDELKSRNIPVQCPILSRGSEFLSQFLVPLFDWLKSEHREPVSELEERDLELQVHLLTELAKRWMRTPSPENEQAFWDHLNNWLDLIEAGHNDAYDIRGRLYDLLSATTITISQDDHDLMIGMGIASQIIRSVEEIQRRRISGQERSSARKVASEVFAALRNWQDRFGESLPVDIKAEGVLVTTVHQAKGLEWPIVIVPMLKKGRFPLRNQGHGTSFPDRIAERYGTQLDDERRLFYVAATRAKERLFLIEPVKSHPKSRSDFLVDLKSRGALFPAEIKALSPFVWEIDQSDLESSERTPLRIGLSDLLIYLECPYQFGLRRVVNVQPSVGQELGFGKGLHELIQRRFDDMSSWSEDQLDAQIEGNVILPYVSAEAESESKRAIKKRIKELERLGVFSARVESEVNLEVLFSHGVVHGIADLIELGEDGSVRIRDWKSNVHGEFLTRYSRQMQFYTYALRSQGREVVSAEIIDVAATNRAGSIVSYEVDISNATLTGLIDEIDVALLGIIDGRFSSRPSYENCSSCDMYRLCSERFIDG